MENKKSNAPGRNKEYKIIVNAREKIWNEKKISFDEVVVLAFGEISPNPNVVYTVTYKKGNGNKPEGTIDRGENVKVKNGMIFNVTQTDKS